MPHPHQHQKVLQKKTNGNIFSNFVYNKRDGMTVPANKEALLGKTLKQLQEIITRHGWPDYVSRQLADWLYKHMIDTVDAMTNLSKKMRREINETYQIGWSAPLKAETSQDGTKKYLFNAIEGGLIESAYIPDGKRHTLCVSSQGGCKMGCSFCMTARQGFQGQLTSGEILNQVRSIPESHLLSNIVYMGMGEPMDNLEAVLDSLEILSAGYGFGMSPRRITVSTIGILPAIQTFLEKSRCHLAISLHSPFAEERNQLIPMEKAHPIDSILDAIRRFPIEKQRRISFEYIVFKDLNHSPGHVKALARLLQGFRCRINLIRFHPIPGSSLQSPDEASLLAFREALENKGITTTIRRSRGQDIHAACGLLSTKT